MVFFSEREEKTMKAMTLFVIALVLFSCSLALARPAKNSRLDNSSVWFQVRIWEDQLFYGDALESFWDIENQGGKHVTYDYANKANTVGWVIYRGDWTRASFYPETGVASNWNRKVRMLTREKKPRHDFYPGERDSKAWPPLTITRDMFREEGKYTLVIGMRRTEGNEPVYFPGDFQVDTAVGVLFYVWGDRISAVDEVDMMSSPLGEESDPVYETVIPSPAEEETEMAVEDDSPPPEVEASAPPDSLPGETPPTPPVEAEPPTPEPPVEEETPPAAG